MENEVITLKKAIELGLIENRNPIQLLVFGVFIVGEISIISANFFNITTFEFGDEIFLGRLNIDEFYFHPLNKYLIYKDNLPGYKVVE